MQFIGNRRFDFGINISISEDCKKIPKRFDLEINEINA